MSEQAKVEAVVHGGAAGLAQEITVAGKHRLVADEPEASGGTDTGATPHGLLIAALGACTSMTLSLYAKRKQWPLEAVTVRLSHTKVRGEDGVLRDEVQRELQLHGALDEEQRARLLEIANKCPVHKTLTAQLDIRTRLA